MVGIRIMLLLNLRGWGSGKAILFKVGDRGSGVWNRKMNRGATCASKRLDVYYTRSINYVGGIMMNVWEVTVVMWM